jgi:excisionase family DNA binding protein
VANDDDTAGLVDISAAGRTLAVSPLTLRRWIRERRISYVRVGRLVRFDPRALARFIEANRIEAREQS